MESLTYQELTSSMAKNGTLKNLRILIHDLLKRKGRSFNDDGLSILELVVAMGIILIITGASIGVYNGINSNAKHAAVERAANDVLKAAMLFESDGLDDTTAEKARDEWTKSAPSRNKVIVSLKREDREIVVSAKYGEDGDISITRSASPNGYLCIDGILIGGKNTGDACVSSESEADAEIPGPEIGDVISRLTYRCDVDTTGYLALTDIEPGTKITMSGGDDSQLVKYSNKTYQELFDSATSAEKNGIITDKVTMKSGIKYNIIVNGQFENLMTPRDSDKTAETSLASCLTEVNKLGEHAGISKMSAFGGNKLVSVPDHIPSSVKTLMRTFYNMDDFNDPNVSKWDTTNVTSLYAAFYGAKKFNQPLNEWNVSNVSNMHAVFYHAEEFNQNLDNWKTGNATNMSSMFGYAYSFNEDIRNWDTSNVKYMSSMFVHTKKFNRNLKNWKTTKVEDMTQTFYGASMFNQDVSMWDVEKVEKFKRFNTGGGILTPEKIPEKFRN